MEAWTSFWGWVLVVTLVIFSLLAVVIAIGGFGDVRGLFRAMDETHEQRRHEGLDEAGADGES